MEHPNSVQSHRKINTASKLPTFRHADIQLKSLNENPSSTTPDAPVHWPNAKNSESLAWTPLLGENHEIKVEHARRQSADVAVDISPSTTIQSPVTQAPLPRPRRRTQEKARNDLAKHHDLSTSTPREMSFQREVEETKNWVDSLEQNTDSDNRKSQSSEPESLSPSLSQSTQPKTPQIPPIRSFRTTRKSFEADATSPVIIMDQDETLRAIDGYGLHRTSNRDQDEQSSDDSDLFLKLAREEAVGSPRYGPIRRVCQASRIIWRVNVITY